MKILQRLSKYLLIAVLCSLAACASTANREGTGEFVDDAVITTKVKAAIFNEPMLKSTEISVNTFKGQVQLSGALRSAAAIAKAVEVARSIGGVKSVKNDMHVK
jgi:osmotically-inducible protein OsmY